MECDDEVNPTASPTTVSITTDEKESMDFEIADKLVIDTSDEAVDNSQSDSDAKNKTGDHVSIAERNGSPSSSTILLSVLTPAVVAEAVELAMNNRGLDGSVSSDSQSTNGATSCLESSGLQLVNSGASSPASVRTSTSKSRRKSDRILPLSGDDGNEAFICPVCSEILPSNHDLTKHIRSHNNSMTAAVSPTTNTCTICQKVLSSQSSLDRHMLVHSGERPFECSLCKTAFTTNGNMHRHMRIHDKEHVMNSENAECGFSPGGSSLHQNRTPRGKKRSGLDHGADDSSECGLSATPPAKRRVLSYDLSSLHNPAAKRIMFDGDLGENSSAKTSNEASSLSTFFKETGSPSGSGLICPVCSQKFISMYGLSYHLEALHGSMSKASLVFPCLPCKLQFCGLEKLTSHMLLVHQRNNFTAETQLVEGLAADDSLASSEIPKKLSSSRASSSSGFYTNLNEILPVVDFSCEKFSLVKQLLSERSPARKVHKLTPSRTGEDAKKNQPTHSCVNCEQLFTSRALCAEHVLQFHNSSTIMTEFSRLAVSSDPRNEDVSGEEFALLLGLKVSANRPVSIPEVTLNKFAVVDANRNLIKAESSLLPVLNPQTAPFLLGHLVALAGAMPHIIPYSLPGVLHLPQQQSLFTANTQLNFQALCSAASESPVRNVSSGCGPLPAAEVAAPAVIMSNGDLGQSSTSEPDHTPADKLDDSMAALDQTNTSGNSVSVTGMEGSSPNDSDSYELKADASDKDSSNNGGSYRCSVCDDSFISYRAYRGHMVSVHLGTSPYKCTQCTYASPDRSTLIRHLRTHNGERPFQCLICDFAFTTKANCERHVRKKHCLESKQDMERSIGFSRCSKELPPASDADAGVLPAVPALASSTVCKYCGEDFKFYRTLKHHLRSQSSCAHKPFMCRTCSVGFSTKPNCLRHIQKRHGPLAAGVTAESLMSVNEVLLVAQQGSSNAVEQPTPQCAISTNAVPSEPMFPLSQQIHQSFLGIMASARPRFDGIGGIMPAHLKQVFNVKLEDVATNSTIGDDDQPLDFSVKSVPKPYPTAATVVTTTSPPLADHDEPMDLTTRPRPSAVSDCLPVPLVTAAATPLPVDSTLSPISFVVASKCTADIPPSSSSSSLLSTLSSTVINNSQIRCPVAGMSQGGSCDSSAKCWQCPYCCTMFKNSFKLMVHMRTHGTDSVHRCYHCLTEFVLKTDLDWHVKTTHPQFADTNNNTTSNKSSSLLDDAAQKGVSENSNTEQNNNIPEAINANLIPTNAMQQTSSKMAVIALTNTVLEPLVGHMENAPVEAHLGPTLFHQQLLANIIGSDDDVSKVNGIAPQGKESDSLEKIIQMEKSMSAKLKTEMAFDGDASVKKKRNSYADSPHKLRCPYCPRAFPWISSLKRHILTHTGQKPFRCPQCPVTFSTKSNRERHMIRKHGLDVHDPATRQMMDRPYKCHLCIFSSFATSGKLVRHYKSKHSDRDLPEGMLERMPTMSHEELNAVLIQLGATIAADNPGGALNLTNDPGDSDDTQNFDMDDSDDDDDSLMNDSLERAAEAVVDAVVRTIVRVPTSSSSPSILDALPNIPVQNRSDGAGAMAASALSQVLQSRTAAGINPERDNYNVDRITECWQCSRVFDCRKSLLRHLKEHGVDLPFKCYLCDASFGARVASLTHKSSAHITDWVILRDKNRVGEDLADFSDFVDRVVDEALAGGTVAPVTARRTRDGVELDVRLESDYAQRKVFCSLCPKRFWSLQDLRRHMRSHTGERPFECDVCHARFTLKHSMMRHRRKHEGSGGIDAGDGHSDSDEESLRDANGENMAMDTTLPDLIQSMPLASAATTSNNTPSLNSTVSTVTAAADGPSDLLQSLLGVSDAATIEHMLDSAVNGVAVNIERHQRAPAEQT